MKGSVSTRALREDIKILRGYWPALEAPSKLEDESSFHKFCFLAEQPEHQEPDFPEGYIPIDFEDDPDAWLAKKAELEQAQQKRRDRRSQSLER